MCPRCLSVRVHHTACARMYVFVRLACMQSYCVVGVCSPQETHACHIVFVAQSTYTRHRPHVLGEIAMAGRDGWSWREADSVQSDAWRQRSPRRIRGSAGQTQERAPMTPMPSAKCRPTTVAVPRTPPLRAPFTPPETLAHGPPTPPVEFEDEEVGVEGVEHGEAEEVEIEEGIEAEEVEIEEGEAAAEPLPPWRMAPTTNEEPLEVEKEADAPSEWEAKAPSDWGRGWAEEASEWRSGASSSGGGGGGRPVPDYVVEKRAPGGWRVKAAELIVATIDGPSPAIRDGMDPYAMATIFAQDTGIADSVAHVRARVRNYGR